MSNKNDCFDKSVIKRIVNYLEPYKGSIVQYSYHTSTTSGVVSRCVEGTLIEVSERRFLIETEWDIRCRWQKDIDENDILVVKKPNKPLLYIFFKDFANTTTSKNPNNLNTFRLMQDFRNFDLHRHVSYGYMTNDKQLVHVCGNLVYVDDVRFVIESENNHCLHAFMFSEINPNTDTYRSTLASGNEIKVDWSKFKLTSEILIKLQPLCDETIDRCISNILNSKLTQQILKDQVMYAVLTNDFYAEANVDILKKYINFKVLGSPIKDNDDWYVKLQILGNIPVHTMDLLKSGNVRAIPHYLNRVDKAPYVESFKLITFK